MNHDREYIEWLKKLGQQRDIFFFKKFGVRDDRSTMRVGTDAVLLGIATRVSEASNILEVGTGSGVITLILAQRSQAWIDALEIDEASVVQARENAGASPWSDRLRVIHSSLQEYVNSCHITYDLIVSNPPFFSRSFKSNVEKRNLSRHDDLLTFEELLDASVRLLADSGQFWVILPVREGMHFRQKAAAAGLHLHSLLHIIPREGKEANRNIMAFSRHRAIILTEDSLTLRGMDNEFSQEYKAFARDFYIDF